MLDATGVSRGRNQVPDMQRQGLVYKDITLSLKTVAFLRYQHWTMTLIPSDIRIEL